MPHHYYFSHFFIFHPSRKLFIHNLDEFLSSIHFSSIYLVDDQHINEYAPYTLNLTIQQISNNLTFETRQKINFKKSMFIFIFNFFENSYLSHMVLDWSDFCVGFLYKDLQACKCVDILETRSFGGQRPFAFLELISF